MVLQQKVTCFSLTPQSKQLITNKNKILTLNWAISKHTHLLFYNTRRTQKRREWPLKTKTCTQLNTVSPTSSLVSNKPYVGKTCSLARFADELYIFCRITNNPWFMPTRPPNLVSLLQVASICLHSVVRSMSPYISIDWHILSAVNLDVKFIWCCLAEVIVPQLRPSHSSGAGC